MSIPTTLGAAISIYVFALIIFLLWIACQRISASLSHHSRHRSCPSRDSSWSCGRPGRQSVHQHESTIDGTRILFFWIRRWRYAVSTESFNVRAYDWSYCCCRCWWYLTTLTRFNSAAKHDHMTSAESRAGNNCAPTLTKSAREVLALMRDPRNLRDLERFDDCGGGGVNVSE